MQIKEVDLEKTEIFSIGRQYSNNVLVIHFANLPNLKNKYIYYKIDDVEEEIPLVSDLFIVSRPLTMHSGKVKAQIIVRDESNETIDLTKNFTMIIEASNYSGIGEDENYPDDPNIKNYFVKIDEKVNSFEELANLVQTKLDNGEFIGAKGPKGEKGDPGDVTEEYRNLASQIAQNASDAQNILDDTKEFANLTKTELNQIKADTNTLKDEANTSAVNAKASEDKAKEYADNLQASTDDISQLKEDLANYIDLDTQRELIKPKIVINSRVITNSENKYGGMAGKSGYSVSKYSVTFGQKLFIESNNNSFEYIQFAFYNSNDYTDNFSKDWFISGSEVFNTDNNHALYSVEVPKGATMICTTQKDGSNIKVYDCVKEIKTSPRGIILDTDINGDVDDLVALRILAQQEKIGIVDIVGINICSPSIYSVEGVDGFVHYEGINDMCLGLEKKEPSVNSKFLESCASYPHYYNGNGDVEDSVVFYKRALDSIPYGEKIDIICIGNLVSLSNVITRYRDLLERKVNKVWIMGGVYPSGQEYNFCGQNNGSTNLKSSWVNATNNVLNNCPVPLMLCGFEIGAQWYTGQILSEKGYTSDLLYVALSDYGCETTGRATWDASTVLIACDNNSGMNGTKITRGTCTINTETGYNTFVEDENGTHYRVSIITKSKMYKENMQKRFDNNILKLYDNGRNGIGRLRLERLPHAMTFSDIPINWVKGNYYLINGELGAEVACEYANIDVTDYRGKTIRVNVSSHDNQYNLFKANDDSIISTFQTDTKHKALVTFKDITVPDNATTLCISNQWNIHPEDCCYVKVRN